MSDDADGTGTATRSSSLSSDSLLELLEDWYHVPVLGAILLYSLWVRYLPAGNFVRGGTVYFAGNDPWYHLRQIQYTVANWPKVMPYDVWTGFAVGTNSGQFGTLYDQIIATVALVVGLGDPSYHTIAMTLAVAPVVFGTLIVVPVYLIGKRLGGRTAGLVGALVLVLLPGAVFSRGVFGAADHNIAEPLFQSMAVLVTLVAVAAADREKPVVELVSDRDLSGLRSTLGWSAVAGVALALYMWMWPPGVLLVGILGTFYLLAMSVDYVRGESPEHLAFVAVTSMLVTTALMLLPLNALRFSATGYTLLQPLLALGVAVGAAFLAWLAREWERRDVDERLYPVAVGALLLLVVGLVAVLLPRLFTQLSRNLIRVVGFGTGAQARTVSEAQPMLARNGFWQAVVGEQYGFAFFTAIIGGLVLLYGVLRRREDAHERFLVAVWFVFLLLAAFTQVRFNYYLAVPVAILTGVTATAALRLAGGVPGSLEELDGTVVVTLVLVLVVVAVPLAVGINSSQVTMRPNYKTSPNVGPSGVQYWDSSLTWMSSETPAEGNYGGAGNATRLDYYGTYKQVDDYDYPGGSYGVMSWWDYGHWITVLGERIPVANPFQQHATTAANYLLASNESAAADVLAANDEDDAKTRFVAVDYQMITPGSKFGAPTVFYDKGAVSASDFRTPYVVPQQGGGGRIAFYLKTQRYYDSQMIRLYRFHGSAVDPAPIVVDYSQQTYIPSAGTTATFAPQGQNAQIIRQFDNMSAARQFVREDGTAQIGGFGDYPTEHVPALQHYRLVHTSAQSAPRGVVQQERFSMPSAWVKLFERVPGARVRGEAPANTSVTASVEMYMPSRNATFTYRQRAQVGPDGTFEMVLPYSTTGYENWGPDQGYTNVSVRATGPYTFTGPRTLSPTGQNGSMQLAQYRATADVPEGKVNGADDSPVSVTLRAQTQGGQSNGGGSSGQASGGNATKAVRAPDASVLSAPPRAGA